MQRPQRPCLLISDPIEHLCPDGDSSLPLMEEAVRRGWQPFHAQAEELSLHGDTAQVRAGAITPHPPSLSGWHRPAARLYDLDHFPTILMRTDPPVDMAYLSACHILERGMGKSLIINAPDALLTAPEKIFVTDFADLMPSTLIAYDRETIARFHAEHGDIVLKPLYGRAGQGIFRLGKQPGSRDALLEMFDLLHPREPIVAQAYLPAIAQGDKRIILIDGEPVGAMLRLPGTDELRSNLAAGGRAEKTSLNLRDHEICERIRPGLKEKNLIFAGIDVIDGKLTEINVTSPTGIRQIDAFDGISIAARLWDYIDHRLS